MQAASFAGLHDTFLHINGAGEVQDAVKRCWSSMWTARATAYRAKNGLDHLSASIAVVVQTMVDAEASGVMFTANPLTARTDEIVINAAWGLGEGIVSGILTPDEFLVAPASRAIRRSTLGSKDVKVVREPTRGVGTVGEPVDPSDRDRFSLTDEQVAELAALGGRVQDYCEGAPQDIEWALKDGRFFLLQSRDVTGADFTWDDEVDAWQQVPENETETDIWSGKWAAEFWTGAITPLFYSARAKEFTNIFYRLSVLWALPELRERRWCKYRRATAFYNTTAEALFQIDVMPTSLRPATLGNLAPERAQAAAAAPFDWGKFLKMQARVHLLEPERGVLRWFEKTYDYLALPAEIADGPGAEALRLLDDRSLIAHADEKVQLAEDFISELWSGFFVYAAWTLSSLGTKLAQWYDGENAFAFQDVISGLPKVTRMAAENHRVWELADQIRRSPELREIFDRHEGPDFFAALQDSQAGRAFAADHAKFLTEFGHRGQTDRDIYYARRSEDPWIDYNAFRVLLSAEEATHPAASERTLIARREAATEEILANVRRKTFGAAKCEMLKTLIAYAHRFLILRDDERWWIDRVTMAKKRAFAEMGRRLVERGVLEGDEDFYFVSQERLYELLRGAPAIRLDRMRIAARRRVFDKFLAREETPPPYLVGDTPADLDAATEPDDGALLGMGTSRGIATGRARIVPALDQIGRLEKGDILVCNATDPGWAPGFLIIAGLIIETGGMLAHGSCLSREYGLPAVQLPRAMQRIEDGALISVNGDTGEIRVLEESEAAEPAAV
jgi:pyruvate,water dikinase